MATRSKKVTPEAEARRRAFRAALALAGTTQRAFAAQIGVSITHLGVVLRGHRHSQRVLDAVHAFVRKQH